MTTATKCYLVKIIYDSQGPVYYVVQVASYWNICISQTSAHLRIKIQYPLSRAIYCDIFHFYYSILTALFE